MRKSGAAWVRAVDLSADDAFEHERLADALLQDALLEYDDFVRVDGRRVSGARWKHWKQHDDVTMYRERSPSDGGSSSSGDTLHASFSQSRYSAFAPPASSSSAATRSESAAASTFAPSRKHLQQQLAPPRLLAVGALAATLDDVMYGIVTPTASAMRLKAAYLQHAEFVDAAVLAEIKTPHAGEPFQFLGLKWMLQRSATARALQHLVRPRDFVFLESSGVHARRDGSGQRVGFHIMHSVELAQCPEKRDRSVQRGAFSSCFLYHERTGASGGGVDVYMTALVQQRGQLIAPLALKAAASMLATNWLYVSRCAENKKLAWLLQTHRQLEPVTHAHGGHGARIGTSRCSLCSKSLKSGLAKKLECQLCRATVCAPCSVARTLRTEGLARDRVLKTDMLFCKKCIALASQENASEIARQELWEQDVVRTGRSQTVLALATRRDSARATTLLAAQQQRQFSSERTTRGLLPAEHTDDEVRSTWHDTDPGSFYNSRNTRGKQPPRSTGAAMRASSSTTTALPSTKAASSSFSATRFSQRRTHNGTWNSSAYSYARDSETTDPLADSRRSTRQASPRSSMLPPRAASSRRSTASPPPMSSRESVASSTALVLLDDRVSSRRMKALDYVHPPPRRLALGSSEAGDNDDDDQQHHDGVDDDDDERISFCSSSAYAESEFESSRASQCSSIAVLDEVDVDAPPPSSAARIGAPAFAMIQEEETTPTPSVASASSSSRRRYSRQPQPQATRRPRSPPHQETRASEMRRASTATDYSHTFRGSMLSEGGRSNLNGTGSVYRASNDLGRQSISSTGTGGNATNGMGGDSTERLSYQMQLWMQMNELRDTAESTYQVAMRNTEMFSQDPQFRNMRFFSQPRLGPRTSSLPAHGMERVHTAAPSAAPVLSYT